MITSNTGLNRTGIPSSNKKFVSLDKFLTGVLCLGVIQAFLANILGTDLPVLQIFAATIFLYSLLSTSKIHINQLTLAILSVLVMLSVLFSAAVFGVKLYQELVYQIYACFCFLFFSVFFNKYDITILVSRRVCWFRGALICYVVLSLIIHVFYWEEVATYFYAKDNDFGGLLMDGRIKRMYGLLFNPLSSAFSALLLTYILFFLGVRDRVCYFLLLVIVLLAFSRSTILLLFLFYLIAFYTSRPKLLFFSAFPLLFAGIVFTLSPMGEALFNKVMVDETGSISEHLRNYKIGFSHALSLIGEGFVDATEFGVWNIRFESMPLQFAFVGGAVLFSLFVTVLIYCFTMLFLRFGFMRASSSLLLLPLFFSFPMHTFSLPMFLLAFVMCIWAPSIRYV